MTTSLEILSPGLISTLQDKGRFGMASSGVPRAGAVDPVSLQIGNALVGNDAYTAAIEFRFMGPKIKAHGGPIRLGLAAETTAILTRADADEDDVEITPWRSFLMHEGDTLAIKPLKGSATGYLTIGGGADVAPVLGSISTYARAGLGGLDGAPLKEGDHIPTHAARATEIDRVVTKPCPLEATPIRVIAGPQDDYFSTDTLTRFTAQPFTVSKDVDRMGIRLEGDEINALPEKGHDLISDGSVPGAIQVPGSGQPIILFTDCQTVGGYPKIGGVIAADMHRLGQLLPGAEIQFEFVDLKTAQAILKQQQEQIEKSIASIAEYVEVGVINQNALYTQNLIDGIVDADRPDHFAGQLEA
ncbi:MAG: biotin-dependent carboxyltransferase family protein [Sneathiella sp.]|nr:biotin-dependent carboxyltransferase family protein [Sneathiella sp.]